MGETGLVLMGGAVLSKSLIQFSVDLCLLLLLCFPRCLTRDQAMVEVMKIMVTSFKRSHGCTDTLSTPNPVAGHHWLMPLPEAPGHSRASLGQLLLGSLLLSPGCWCPQGSVCASKSLFPQSCVRSGSSTVG